jgi:hypothetical protein
MAFAIHEAAMKKQHTINVMRPQEHAPNPLPENWGSTMGGGLPVMQIPHLEFPRCIYLHPNEPTRVIVHRNDKFEVVGEEIVPTEHLTKVINTPEELQVAMAEGWVKEPYIPKAAPNPEDKLYGKRKTAKSSQ